MPIYVHYFFLTLGTSGGMEIAGAQEIFDRSKERLVRYTEYLGDGDSKAFNQVAQSQPYGPDCEIKKLECVGHVEKRMGTRIRKLKATERGKKLSDGKPIGGKNRLTDDKIGLIQNYYGEAIRKCPDDLDKMKKSIWAEFYHISSTNDVPQHGLCDIAWCKYKQAQASKKTYNHNSHFHLAPAIMEALRPIFKDLSHPTLLEKCLHGKTQNPNESFHNLIWERIPKTTFVTLPTLKMGVYEAVGCFNDGNIFRCRVLEEAKIDVGEKFANTMMTFDKRRLKKADLDQKQLSKTARRNQSRAKTRLELRQEEDEEEAGPSYVPGGH